MSKNSIILFLCAYQLFCSVAKAGSCVITSNVNLNFNCLMDHIAGCMAVGSISFQCNSPTEYSFSINQGSSGNYMARTMLNSNDASKKIEYNLYATANQQNIIGDGTQGSILLHGNCTSCVITLYGYISQKQQYPVWEGIYNDNLIGTFNYN